MRYVLSKLPVLSFPEYIEVSCHLKLTTSGTNPLPFDMFVNEIVFLE